ncbi:hypothetical protein [Streptomyces anulatus]|uniref:hypothetical protein n=1 Tax=Streptomyces anulatus TaxID=1892 RepID=UPI003448EDDF
MHCNHLTNETAYGICGARLPRQGEPVRAPARLTRRRFSPGGTRFHVALHLDVDAIDGTEGSLGLARVSDGFTGAEANRIAQDIQRGTDFVAVTVAEFIPLRVRMSPSPASRTMNDDPHGCPLACSRGSPGRPYGRTALVGR